VILADENLNLTSLRMYNEAGDLSGYQVKVSAATHPKDAPNLFHERIAGLVDAAKDPWKSFSSAVYGAVPMRVENLKAKIKQWR
jgi:hypothetical protein